VKVVREIFSGVGGGISSKRTMIFLSFLVMLLIAWANIFMEREVQQFIFEGFMWIVLGGLFSVASEQFGQKFGEIKKEQPSFDEPSDDCEKQTPRRRSRK
jgi:hypothetical protein